EDQNIDPSQPPADGQLKESVCVTCGARAFPARTVCISCMGTNLASALLPDTGTLYSYSTVHVSSSRSTPYVLGYVDLPDGVRLLAEIHGNDRISVGVPVTLRVESDRW